MTRTKRTPKQWVDELLWQGPHNWVPPVSRYDGPDPDTADESTDWHAEWGRLNAHHQREMDVLNAVIRELVRRLEKRE